MHCKAICEQRSVTSKDVAISDAPNFLGDPFADGISSLLYEAPNLVFVWGDRLHEYQEPIMSVLRQPHSALGEFATNVDAERALRPQRHKNWELEIVLRDFARDDAMRRIVAYGVADERLVDELVRAYKTDADRRRSAITDVYQYPLLAALNAQRFDIGVATVWADQGFQFCIRLVRVFWTQNWLLAIWGPPSDGLFQTYSSPAKWDTESAEGRSAALPARRPYHLPEDVPRDIGGPEALIRFACFVLGHHQWSVAIISQTLERWQSAFFEAAGDGRGPDPLTLMAPLSDAGRSIVLMRPPLQRLSTILRFPPFVEYGALTAAADSNSGALQDASSEVRDAYALAASGASIYQALQAERKTAADRRLQRVASVLAAFVLWPGLVATLYGADIRGLPGQGTRHGLFVLAILSAVGALITLLALLVTLRGRDS